jgi:hypothetical protein
MAKAGRQAQRFRNDKLDLSRLKMSDEQVQAKQERVELSNGLRCGGCGRRIGRGFGFTSIAVREEAPIMRLSACSRDDCDYATACRAGSTYCEELNHVWLDPEGVDAPAAKFIVERNERVTREQEAKRATEKPAEARAAQSG